MSVEIVGVVVEGDHRGRELGFPTANVVLGSDEAVADGVYAGHAVRADGSRYEAAISIGRRPTYHSDDSERLVEAHLLDFDDDLYGELLTVLVGDKVRGQERFDSSEALIAQMKRDVDDVRRLLGAARGSRFPDRGAMG